MIQPGTLNGAGINGNTWAVGRALDRVDCPIVLCVNGETLILIPAEARDIAAALVQYADQRKPDDNG